MDVLRRLLTLAILLALTITNGAAVAAAKCRHDNAAQHLVAMSAQLPVAASEAHDDEGERDRGAKGALSGAAASLLAALMIPADGPQLPRLEVAGLDPWTAPAAAPPGLSISPLLDPPLAR